jgi:hypothetical protein
MSVVVPCIGAGVVMVVLLYIFFLFTCRIMKYGVPVIFFYKALCHRKTLNTGNGCCEIMATFLKIANI